MSNPSTPDHSPMPLVPVQRPEGMARSERREHVHVMDAQVFEGTEHRTAIRYNALNTLHYCTISRQAGGEIVYAPSRAYPALRRRSLC